jgi:hypothetical protein
MQSRGAGYGDRFCIGRGPTLRTRASALQSANWTGLFDRGGQRLRR